MIPWGDVPVLCTCARVVLPLYGGRVAAAAWRRLKPANSDHAPAERVGVLRATVSRVRIRAAERAPAVTAGVALTRARLAPADPNGRFGGRPARQTPLGEIHRDASRAHPRAEGAPGPTGRAAPAARTGGSAPAGKVNRRLARRAESPTQLRRKSDRVPTGFPTPEEAT